MIMIFENVRKDTSKKYKCYPLKIDYSLKMFSDNITIFNSIKKFFFVPLGDGVACL